MEKKKHIEDQEPMWLESILRELDVLKRAISICMRKSVHIYYKGPFSARTFFGAVIEQEW